MHSRASAAFALAPSASGEYIGWITQWPAEAPNLSIEHTSQRLLRTLCAAAHVGR
jgi:hypothetical protein